MLLKSILTACISFVALNSFAQSTTVLTTGNYTLSSGPKNLCETFVLSKKDISAKVLWLGTHYSFETRNSTHNTQSDLDENCEFREQNAREDRAQELVLTRTNEEVCKGNVSSRTFTRATITADDIQIYQEVDGGPAHTCVFKKKTK